MNGVVIGQKQMLGGSNWRATRIFGTENEARSYSNGYNKTRKSDVVLAMAHVQGSKMVNGKREWSVWTRV